MSSFEMHYEYFSFKNFILPKQSKKLDKSMIFFSNLKDSVFILLLTMKSNRDCLYKMQMKIYDSLFLHQTD